VESLLINAGKGRFAVNLR